MRSNKVTANYLYNVAYQVLTFLTPIITAPHLARVLGAENLGIYNYTYSIVYWFILFGTMGISLYGSKEIARVSDNREKLSKKFSEIFCLQLLCMFGSILIFYLIFLMFNFKYKIVFLLQGATLIPSALEITWLYIGLEDFRKTTIRGFLIKILIVLGIIFLIKDKSDLNFYIVFLAISNTVGSLMIWKGIKKILDFKIPKIKDIVPHFKENFILFIPQIASSIYSVFDQTMIGFLYSDVSEVGFYSQAHKLVNMVLFVVTTIGAVMLPNIVKKRKQNDDNKVKEVTNLTFKIALFLSIPMAIGFSVVAPYFIPWFLPLEFEKVAYIICFLSPLIVFISITNVFGLQFLIPMDKAKKYTISVTSGCFVNLILNMCLIGRFGAYGAATASCITELAVLLMQYYYVRKDFYFHGIIKKVFKYLSVALVMGSLVYIIGFVMGVGLVTNIIQVIVGIIVYVGLLYVLKDNVEMFLLGKVKDLLKIKR